MLESLFAFFTGALGPLIPAAGGFLGVAASFLGSWKIKLGLIAVAVLAVGIYVLVNKVHIAELRAQVATEKAARAEQTAETKIANERLAAATASIDACSRANATNLTEIEKIRADGERAVNELGLQLARVQAEKQKVVRIKEKINASPTECSGVTQHGRDYVEWLRERAEGRAGGAPGKGSGGANKGSAAARPGPPVSLLPGAKPATRR